MFMLPVSEAEALNIVVSSPCWKYGKTDVLSFKYLSMAFRNQKNLDRMFIRFFLEESFKTNVIVFVVLFLS